MTRFVPVTVLMVWLAASGVADADIGTLPGNATLRFDKLFINENGDGFVQQSDPTALRRYFNLPHCQCSQKGMGKETEFEYLITLDMVTNGPSRAAQFWVGPGCDVQENRNASAMMCRSLTDMGLGADKVSIPDIDSLPAAGGYTLKLSIYDVFAGFNPDKGCTSEESDKTIWLLMDTDNNTAIDYGKSQIAGKVPGDTTTPATGMDTFPPPAPLNLSGAGGENSILLTWAAPTSRADDISLYQALCARADGMPPPSGARSAQYQTSLSLCNIADDPKLLTPSGGTTAGVDAGVGLPDPLTKLDPAYICGQADGPTATSMTIEGLENNVAYNVVLLAIDLHGNYAGSYLTQTITPVPATDFWEDLHNRESKVEGGLCLLAETYGDDSTLTRLLRVFRDDTLGGSRAGRWLTDAYYASLARLGALVHASIALRVIAAVALAPLVGIALLWHWLTLPGLLALLCAVWCRRRWRSALSDAGWLWLRVPRIAAIAVVMLGTGRAYAGGNQPYWENSAIGESSTDEVPVDDPSLIEWHAGLRLGPYVPDIDSQFATPAGQQGPYEQMYGGYHMMTMLDVDRVIWTGYGQVAVGGSIGYWQKTARPFTKDSKFTDVMRARQPGERTAFRLIPLELAATYRLTTLDDDYGVPLIPYLRGGLAYYVWWMTTPNGNFSRICDDSGQMCGDKALGASLGVQGAIGLSIRAERIDASTAMSMKNSGIQHAGVYVELSAAKVDGFGSDKKLSVGATTWFAGIDFEF